MCVYAHRCSLNVCVYVRVRTQVFSKCVCVCEREIAERECVSSGTCWCSAVTPSLRILNLLNVILKKFTDESAPFLSLSFSQCFLPSGDWTEGKTGDSLSPSPLSLSPSPSPPLHALQRTKAILWLHHFSSLSIWLKHIPLHSPFTLPLQANAVPSLFTSRQRQT